MSEELREQFQELFLRALQRDGLGFYCEPHTQSMWEGFQECAKSKDAEIAELKAHIKGLQVNAQQNNEASTEQVSEMVEEIEKLNARVAMMLDCLEQTADSGLLNGSFNIHDTIRACVYNSITAAEPDVTKWVNGVKADALEELKRETPTDSNGCFVHSSVIDSKIKELRGE